MKLFIMKATFEILLHKILNMSNCYITDKMSNAPLFG